MRWEATLGACYTAAGTRFRVWAPEHARVDVVVESGPHSGTLCPLIAADGMFSATVSGLHAGDQYRYCLDGERLYPDPASRFQPRGIHGPSEIVDPNRFTWGDETWPGLSPEELVIYELHMGTLTPSGTFAAATDRLTYLCDLGVTAIEIMPVGDFPGRRNWGYDGVALFAPARCYGRPDDLRRLVDTAHRLGLGVILDVVYNHLGPDGNYLACFSPFYFSTQQRTPWGAAVNLDAPGSAAVRAFFIENALHWVHEYHVDGLRLDATHALHDESPRHFLAELSSRVRESVHGRAIVLIAEDHRNLACMVRPQAAGGFGMDAVWADDLHHQVRRAIAGDHEGYYADYGGSMADIAATLRRGWFFCGQPSQCLGRPRGTDPSGLAAHQFVICLENHDQIGNRAFGDRLHHHVDPAAYRAATVLLLCAPETPLLFMGQEWAATSPFLFFTDHNPSIGRLVTAGRRAEFKSFSTFTDARRRERIPDPQAAETFERSILNWCEVAEEPHASVLRLYQVLLKLRTEIFAGRRRSWTNIEATAAGAGVIILRYMHPSGRIIVAVQLCGAGSATLVEPAASLELLLSTEEARFVADARAPDVEAGADASVLRFHRPGALIFRSVTRQRQPTRNTCSGPFGNVSVNSV